MTEPVAQQLAIKSAEWGDADTERNLTQVKRRIHARARQRVGLYAAACAVFLIAVGTLGYQRLFSPERTVAAVGNNYRGPQPLSFADDSSIEFLSSDAELQVVEAGRERIQVKLPQGHARFTVTPNAQRNFRVVAGSVQIDVLGTIFTVNRQKERVHVGVERGRVRVSYEGGARVLEAKEASWFPPRPEATVASAEDALPSKEPAAALAEVQKLPAQNNERQQFLDYHKQGAYQQAYEILRQQPNVLRNTAQDLMLAADAARLAGHPGQAADYLRRVTSNHRSNSRAPLAAFTLGRLYLYELGQPKNAASAFSLARGLAPGGVLAHDALVREVEALAKAGDKPGARRLARQYQKTYPSGRRMEDVKRYGGLE